MSLSLHLTASYTAYAMPLPVHSFLQRNTHIASLLQRLTPASQSSPQFHPSQLRNLLLKIWSLVMRQFSNFSCRALRRSRHHCRLCGGIFCASCSSTALLLPPKFQQQQPKRLCDPCAELLEPLQPFLAGSCLLCALISAHTLLMQLLH